MQYCPTCNRQYEGDDFVKCPYDGSNLTPLDAVGSDPLIGTQFGESYQIIRVIGEGGMGKVYEARHVRLSKRYAIKILHPQFNANDQTIARFRREAEAASAIGMENILDVIDFNSTPDGVYYIVTEYLEGRSLARAFAEDGIMKIPRALSILHQMARALTAAHSREIVHRDLKPENIFLVRRFETDDFVKVLDFGISKVRSGGDRLTQAGQIIGTPHYMSPEQAQGELNLDHRSDIYSLGAIMYEMFTGRLPFDAESVQRILVRLLTEEPPPPRTQKPDLPEDIEAVILKAMAKDPAARYSTMAELDRAIAQLYAHHVGGDLSTPASTAGLGVSQEHPAYQPRGDGFGTGPTLAAGGSALGDSGQDLGGTTGEGVVRSIPSTGGWGTTGGSPTPDPIGQRITVERSAGKSPVALIVVLLLVLAGGGGGAYWFFVLRGKGGAADKSTAQASGMTMDKPGMDTPGMDTPGMDTPGMDTPGMDTPGMDTPGMDTPGMKTGIEKRGMET
ncbi:MAG: serine/threonine-protein kinase, partial [bacterium]